MLVGNVGGSLRAVPGEQLAPHPRGPTAGIPDLRHQAEPAVFPNRDERPAGRPRGAQNFLRDIMAICPWESQPRTTAADGLVTTKKSHQHHRIHGDPPNPCVEHEEHEPSNPDTQQQGEGIHLSQPWQPNLESRSISLNYWPFERRQQPSVSNTFSRPVIGERLIRRVTLTPSPSLSVTGRIRQGRSRSPAVSGSRFVAELDTQDRLSLHGPHRKTSGLSPHARIV